MASEARQRERAQGRCNTLDWDAGYGPDSAAHWFDEEETLTRLGEPRRTLYLARLPASGERVEPWPRDTDDLEATEAWRLGAVDVRASKLVDVDLPPTWSERMETLRNELDLAGHDRIVPLRPAGKTWRATGRDDDGRPVEVTYSTERGLEIERND